MTATDDSDQCRPTSGTGPPAGSPGHEPIGPKPYRKAVVIGGSIAGLMAARALADFFEEVHVFERDEYPDTPAARRGVPQAHHAHGLLARGRHIIEGFFPGIVAEMIDDGALLIDQVQDRLRLAPYGWQDRFPSDLTALMITRTLLEASIRRRTLRIGNIRITDNTAVQGLTSAGNTVTGLVLARRAHVEADLVVEAGGRGSSAHSWLEEHGFGRVEEEAIDARWGYASRFYRTPDPWPFDWTLFNMWPQVRASGSQRTRGGTVSRQDGGRCIVTLVGNAGDVPPRDENGFREFARSLDSGVLADFIEAAEPINAISVSRSTVNRFRHYERLANRPDRFIVVGDALAAFNPVYGQGMAASAMCAEALSVELHRWTEKRGGLLDGFASHLQDLVVETVQFPWTLSVTADSRLAECEGAAPQDPTIAAYVERVIALTSQDPALLIKHEEMANLLRRNDWMFEPEVKQRVVSAWDSLGDKVGAPAVATPSIESLR